MSQQEQPAQSNARSKSIESSANIKAFDPELELLISALKSLKAALNEPNKP